MTSANWFSNTFKLPGHFKEPQIGGAWLAQLGDSLSQGFEFGPHIGYRDY